ncbi:uncharacterized protein LOC118701445 [Molothrus ater]|uniref:uncharacterized protein LOC118701445 n=1 Tax=Molothrus ater TaxID=84834 RepID=UPI00174DE1AE|nr:uncharacterized protein LOC118701445 [Molothrus ater]
MGKRLQCPWSASSASAAPGATVCRDSPFQKEEDLVWDRLLSWQQLSRAALKGRAWDLVPWRFPKVSLLQEAPGTDMEQRPPRVPKLAWVEEKEEEEGPGMAPAQETEEVVPFHPPQEDAALERTQEQESSRGRFRRTAQLVCDFIRSIGQEETSTMGTGLRAHSELLSHETSAALLDLLLEKGVARPEQVPAMVRSIHRWLLANDSAQHRLDKALLNLTRAQPGDAVVTLLRVAPSCDRYGAHLPRGLRPPQPITLYRLAQVSEQQRVPGPSGCCLSQPWHVSPRACCHAPLPSLRGLSPQGWAAWLLLARPSGQMWRALWTVG